jgi:hypothetical protein
MADKRLIDLETERDALRQASGSTELQGVLAAISAEMTKQAQIIRAGQKKEPIAAVVVPDIDNRASDSTWLDDRSFTLTPTETWLLLRGYAVKPRVALTAEMLSHLEGKNILSTDGYLRFK